MYEDMAVKKTLNIATRKISQQLSIQYIIASSFLVACMRLYKPLCWSVRPSVADSSEHATYGDQPCFFSDVILI